MSSKYVVDQLSSRFSNIQQARPLVSPTTHPPSLFLSMWDDDPEDVAWHCSAVWHCSAACDFSLLQTCCLWVRSCRSSFAKSHISVLGLLFMCCTWQVQLTTGAARAVWTYTHKHHFPRGYCSLFLILDSHLAVFTMENSVPLKNPCSAFCLEVGIDWVALSRVFHKHTSISPLLAPFG